MKLTEQLSIWHVTLFGVVVLGGAAVSSEFARAYRGSFLKQYWPFLGDPKVSDIPLLLQALSNDKHWIRKDACTLLGKLGLAAKDANPTLIAHFHKCLSAQQPNKPGELLDQAYAAEEVSMAIGSLNGINDRWLLLFISDITEGHFYTMVDTPKDEGTLKAQAERRAAFSRSSPLPDSDTNASAQNYLIQARHHYTKIFDHTTAIPPHFMSCLKWLHNLTLSDNALHE